jgi:hypothetical protein
MSEGRTEGDDETDLFGISGRLGRGVCGSEVRGEGFERIGVGGGDEERADFVWILDGIDVGAEAVGDGSEAEIKSTENGLAVAADDDDAEFFEIGERFDALADAIRDVPEADVEGFEGELAVGGEGVLRRVFRTVVCGALLFSLMTALFGVGHGAGAEGRVADRVNLAVLARPVNWMVRGELAEVVPWGGGGKLEIVNSR